MASHVAKRLLRNAKHEMRFFRVEPAIVKPHLGLDSTRPHGLNEVPEGIRQGLAGEARGGDLDDEGTELTNRFSELAGALLQCFRYRRVGQAGPVLIDLARSRSQRHTRSHQPL